MSLVDYHQKGFKSGFVALIGRPNVGKSTLLNKLIGQKVAITSPIAQTTRNRLRAILTNEHSQTIFVDTPGIHKPHHLLGQRLVQSARKVIGDVDIVLAIFESSFEPGKGDAFILNLLNELKIPVVVALNKWDLVSINSCEQRKNSYIKFLEGTNWPVFFCSAISGKGCDELIKYLSNCLPEGPQLYPSDLISDQPEKILMAELIREQVLIHTREEIPHSVAVTIDRIQELSSSKGPKKKITTGILATVFVERKSQKAILIGKSGSMLKKIGKGARMQIQTLIVGNVFLEIFVKVVPNWRSKPSHLNALGYGED